MGIRSKSDAVQHLLDRFSNKEKDYRIINSIQGALGGAALGSLAHAAISKARYRVEPHFEKRNGSWRNTRWSRWILEET